MQFPPDDRSRSRGLAYAAAAAINARTRFASAGSRSAL